MENNLQQFVNEKCKDFEEKFLGTCPYYHDPNTHQSFPSAWKEKMLNIADVKSFLRQALAAAYEMGYSEKQ